MSRATHAAPSGGHFAFDIVHPGKRTTIVYWANPWIDAQSVAAAIEQHVTEAVPPDEVLLLTSQCDRDAVAQVAADSQLARRLPAVTRYVRTPAVTPAVVERDGSIQCLRDAKWSGLPPSDSAHIFQAGMRQIFRTHTPILASSTGWHWVRPSGRHSVYFLRTANLLTRGAEISFIAAATLRLLPPGDINMIFTDSSSIFPVAFALKEILAAVDDDGASVPSIATFASYSGMNQPGDLGAVESSVALISAATSGGMRQQLFEMKNIPVERQAILYYVGPPARTANIACDVTARPDNPDGTVEIFQSWPSGECILCEQGQSTVDISGEQFLPANPTVTPRTIRAIDAPTWLSQVADSLRGRGVLRCHGSNGTSGSMTRTIYLDVTPLFGDDTSDRDLDRALRKAIQRDIPAATRSIVYLDDEGSASLGGHIRDHLENCGVPIEDDRFVRASDLTQAPLDFKLGEGVAVVAASVVVSGRSLLAVSQALRDRHQGQPIQYFVLAARMSDAKKWRDAISNLQYGPASPREHAVTVVQEMQLPDDREGEGSPWTAEVLFWQQADEELLERADRPPELDQFVLDRVGRLNSAIGNGGLSDELFLDPPGADPMRLQPSFAFWKSGYEDSTQAEVYFTMSAVLQNMRQERGSRYSALVRDHNWTVLAPGNFARYNDGVVQASILRAARRFELDYSADVTLSRTMTGLLTDIFLRHDSPEGAATQEFLLSIAQARLRLSATDSQDLVVAIEAMPTRGSASLWALKNMASKSLSG